MKMGRSGVIRIVVGFLLAGSVSLSAQWPSYPTAGVPKTPDGKPNMDAPAPKTADGKPDLSGLWEITFGFGGGRRGAPPAPPAGPPVASFFNIAAGLKDGRPPLRPWAAELLKKRKDENSKDNPDAHCLPMGLMQLHGHPQPRKIIQTPAVTVILYEGNSGIRQIFTDGRPLPKNDPQPWWYGYSIGHWEGDTLVVETTGFRDDVWLDVWGTPLTEAGRMTERFRRPSYGKLEIDVTIDDPKAYTEPFTVRVNQRLTLDSELIEFICGENEKSVPHLVGK